MGGTAFAIEPPPKPSNDYAVEPPTGSYQQFKGGPTQNISSDVSDLQSGKYLMEREGESDPQFLARAREAGRSVTPQMIQTEHQANIKQIPKVLGAAAAAGPAQILAGESVAAPLEAGWQALATRSLQPLIPFARAYLGSKIGGYVGRDVGGWVGHPEAGQRIGEVGGGLYGGLTKGTLEHPWTMARNAILGSEKEIPAVATEAATPTAAPTAIPTVEAPMRPAPTIRRGPGEIAPERVGAPLPRVPQAPSTGSYDLPGGGTLVRPVRALPAMTETPAEVPTGRAAIRTMNDLVSEQMGGNGLKPNVPIGQQPRAVGADVLKPMQSGPSLGVIPRVPPGSRVAVPISEEFGPAVKAPEKLPTMATEEVGRQAGAPPLQKNVPLRGQFKPTGEEPMSEKAALEQKYPDKGDRQMVHIVGEKMFNAIGKDPDLMRQAADLKGPDVRQAAINLGEDMAQISVGTRKAMGESQIAPQRLLDRLLDKGFTPRQIVEAAKQPLH